MHLKKLTLSGFKTFADKTEIDLSDGLTAIVGPNGCGKSNIADAILWVLGEQNPRSLRATDNQDVIFAGTDRRKPVGMAEVRLTIDNADGSLPVSFAEVAVARRLFRSGESQYLMNGSPCRMKDIVDLFLDTGMGKGAYSFVGQSEIDAVLSARPEDRRALFEEAAGIQKYRTRKREAQRKLEQTRLNLARVHDIVRELSSQREPLRKQAEAARDYREVSARLREIEVGHLAAEAREADYDLYVARRECELGREALLRDDAELARIERESEGLLSRLQEAETELENARLAQQSALTRVERAESRLGVLRERAANAERALDEIDCDRKAIQDRIAASEKEAARLRKALVPLEASADHQADAAKRLEAAHSAAIASHEARRREVAEARSRMFRHAQERAERVANRSAVLQKAARVRAELESAIREADRLRSELSDAEKLRGDLQNRVKSAEGVREGSVSALEAARTASGAAAAKLDSARESCEKLAREQANATSRLEALEEMRDAGDGYYQGVRAVLGAAKQGKLAGSYTPLADLLSVPEKLRIAIEVALGAAAQDLVCDTEVEARAGIEWLKRNRAGRATFLALDRLRPPESLEVGHGDGLLGVAADLAQFEERYLPAIRLALGRVAVATGMESARRASESLKGWSRIVTVEGEVITPGGAITGGSLQGRGAHLVGRKGEIDDLRARLSQLGEQARRAGELARLAASDADASASALAETEASFREADRDLAAAAVDTAHAEREAERLASRLSAEESRAKALREQAGALEADLADRDQDCMDAHEERAPSLDGMEAELQQLSAEVAEAASSLFAKREELGVLRERLVRSRAEADSLEKSAETARQELGERLARRERLAIELRQSEEESGASTEDLAEARGMLLAREAEASNWKAKRQELLAANFERTSLARDVAQRRAETQRDIHEGELAAARSEMKLGQIAERLREEYVMELAELLEGPKPSAQGADLGAEVARLRKEIRRMGDVNTGAAEEYDRLTERLEFLDQQRQDLEAASERVRETIEEIDKGTREVFLETFLQVQLSFQDLFSRLFGGGAARLTLTNKSDLLETGIEIDAQPPGKKLQRLSLLSGGERALTAVALLFAFLVVKPSPFVVLDEVDAPLDGSNVEKFARLVREFSQSTQFLVITHNVTTMELAPRWYGVTMPDAGVSRVLAYRVPADATETPAEEALHALTA